MNHVRMIPSLMTLNKIQEENTSIISEKIAENKRLVAKLQNPFYNEDVTMFRVNQITFMCKDKQHIAAINESDSG